jgi:S-DNA-T family DNA segregation ATPase FtsK/SpoIIIE
MKWFDRILVNKTSRLPWIEIHAGNENIKETNEQTRLYVQDNENPLKSSLKEVLSIYNNETEFSNEGEIEESVYQELPQKNYTEFIPLSDIDNFSDQNFSNKNYKNENSNNDINDFTFSVFPGHTVENKIENNPDEFFVNSNLKETSVAEDISVKTDWHRYLKKDIINNDLIFQMESKSSVKNFLTMEFNLNQTTDSPYLRGSNNQIQNNFPNEIPDFDDDEVIEGLPISPNEELLLSPLTAANYEDLPADEDIFFLNKENPDLIENQVADTFNPNPLNKEQHEKKHANFRCSVTPEITTGNQFQIPFNILHMGEQTDIHSDPAEVQSVIEKLESTLEQFGIEARVIGMQKGPIITRYEIRIPPGIKVNRILGLTDELAMALEALRVRIEAPIPGRSTVGIEIPNKKRSTVLLGDVLNHPDYHPETIRLPLPLGKDIAGNNIIEDLTRMPHILIAGATGSGKSVAINSIITSMIISKSPEDVRMLMVDPKLVELSQYNDIPHLLHPVIADPQKAILGLNWAVEEMERRYEDMADMRARDIVSYNLKIDAHNKKSRSAHEHMPKMPYIVILIDELGDLMMVAGKEVESSIIRLSQKARAIGIHLILATQRPSVDVITALIKANCPARIALQVAQKTDSRTILDSNGGEQLLGQGDMLFKHPSRAQLIRAQAPYVSDQEVENVVHKIKELAKPSYIILEDPRSKSGELEVEDEDLFDEAWQIITESNKASASYLQRRLRIGYNRAARLIEAFEARGYIGPQVGSKPREIIGVH